MFRFEAAKLEIQADEFENDIAHLKFREESPEAIAISFEAEADRLWDESKPLFSEGAKNAKAGAGRIVAGACASNATSLEAASISAEAGILEKEVERLMLQAQGLDSKH